ncbi:hypothetical protein [Cytobacillus pseudoceanisediminis]
MLLRRHKSKPAVNQMQESKQKPSQKAADKPKAKAEAKPKKASGK